MRIKEKIKRSRSEKIVFAIAFIILLGVLLLVVLASKILRHDSQKRIDNIENIV